MPRQGSIYWTIPPLGEYQPMSFGEKKNLKRRREKGEKCKRKRKKGKEKEEGEEKGRKGKKMRKGEVKE